MSTSSPSRSVVNDLGLGEKVERDAFIYLEPKTSAQKEYFAQCGPCRMFVPTRRHRRRHE